MAKQLFVSVVIPTYNRAQLIIDSIDSVLQQTYSFFELLIVDDHSTDDTETIVKKYKDSRIKYILNKNKKGAQGARNTGLKSANGEWVALLDSDDIWKPEKLEKQVDYLKKCNKNISGLSTGIATFDFEHRSVIDEKIPPRQSFSTKELLYKNYLRGFSSFIFNRKKALKMGGFDESFPAMQDMDFYVSLSLEGEIHVLEEVLVYVRTDNEDRISTNYLSKYTGAKCLHEKYKDYISSSFLLKNRSISRLILYSLKISTYKWIKYSHWILIGAIIDFKNFTWLMKSILRR